jgi:hypothetical protein
MPSYFCTSERIAERLVGGPFTGELARSAQHTASVPQLVDNFVSACDGLHSRKAIDVALGLVHIAVNAMAKCARTSIRPLWGDFAERGLQHSPYLTGLALIAHARREAASIAHRANNRAPPALGLPQAFARNEPCIAPPLPLERLP